MIVGYEQALAIIQERILPSNPRPPVETVDLQQALGRILAADVLADRDYPPFHRSIRDGYAVHAADASATPATLRSIGEVRAGEPFGGQIGAGQCVSIMTGAPLPAGVDAVVMLEYTEAVGGQVKVLRAVRPGENVVKQGSEALSGARVLSRGRRIGTGEVGLLAMVGQAQVAVYPKPTVAMPSRLPPK
jgi:molybdopterin molybdotransferase